MKKLILTISDALFDDEFDFNVEWLYESIGFFVICIIGDAVFAKIEGKSLLKFETWKSIICLDNDVNTGVFILFIVADLAILVVLGYVIALLKQKWYKWYVI